MMFLGVSGHHGPNMSAQALVARKGELFAKTALFINAEHTSTLLSQVSWESIRWSNTYTPQFWYAGGPTRPRLQDIATRTPPRRRKTVRTRPGTKGQLFPDGPDFTKSTADHGETA
jgi:hypothetical protein